MGSPILADLWVRIYAGSPPKNRYGIRGVSKKWGRDFTETKKNKAKNVQDLIFL
jgi:hypothetical protein